MVEMPWLPANTEFTRRWREVVWCRDGYQLEYRKCSPGDTPDTGWYLYGPNGVPFGVYMGRLLAEAKAEGSKYIRSAKRVD